MKNICVIGVGYVGLTTGTCFADMGNKVVAVDISEERVSNLRKGILPIYEPGLKEIVERNTKAGRLYFTTSYEEGLKDAEYVFICVGTPEGVDGEADLQYVRVAAETIATKMDHPLIVINKSTVPVGTGDWVAQIIKESQPKPIKFAVVSCPEFLREGSAIRDFQHPDRTVLGSNDRDAAHSVAQLYIPLRAPTVITDLRTAEMIKYASNAFLATRISFINEIANICEALGADVKEVAQGMGYDKRIGHSFLEAGVGYGGSCFLPNETIFAVEGEKVRAQSIQSLFESSGDIFKGDAVEVISPTNRRVLSFDMETGCPEVTSVHALTRRPYNGTMVALNTSMGRKLTVTADHPVIRYNVGHVLDVVQAADVKAGDRIMTLTELPPIQNAPESLNLIELLRDTELANDVIVSCTDNSFAAQYAGFAGYIPPEILKFPHDIKQGNRMSLRLYYYLTAQGVLDVEPQNLQLYTAKGAATKINAIIPVDGDLMRLIGYYLAEGYVAIDTGRVGAQRERVGFCFHEEELVYIEDVQKITSLYGLKFITRNSTHATTTIISSRIFAWLLRDVLGCGTRSENKTLPTLAFSVSTEMRFQLIRGAFSGDGSLTTVQGGKNAMLEYATVSKRLADGITLLLQSIGVVPSIRVRMMNKSTQPAYIIRVSGFEQLSQMTHAFGEKRREQLENILAGYQRRIKQHGFSRQSEYAVLDVLETEHTQYEGMVYSLETQLHTVIVGSGLVVHNCFPKDVKALAYMAQVNGKHPELLQAVMEINKTQRRQIVNKLEDLLHDVSGKAIAMLGLAFKENTDDIRESPALDIAQMLHDRGAIVRGYDPEAMEAVQRHHPYIQLAEDPYELARGVDALVVATPWNEFKNLNMNAIGEVMKQKILVDGRNLYDAEQMKELGFVYRGVGRGYNGHGHD
jgi:UDPglucose 6-dehydrogenase